VLLWKFQETADMVLGGLQAGPHPLAVPARASPGLLCLCRRKGEKHRGSQFLFPLVSAVFFLAVFSSCFAAPVWSRLHRASPLQHWGAITVLACPKKRNRVAPRGPQCSLFYGTQLLTRSGRRAAAWWQQPRLPSSIREPHQRCQNFFSNVA